MSIHLHLIVSAKNNDLSEILRDFKRFTSPNKSLKLSLTTSMKVVRIGCLKFLGKKEAKMPGIKITSFWRQDNRPQELYNPAFVFQKINYIHNNPVEARMLRNQKIIYPAELKIIMQRRSADYLICSFFKQARYFISIFLITIQYLAVMRE